MTEKLDLDHLRQWIGRTTEVRDTVTPQLVRGLRATLFQEIGEPKPGDAAPFTVHWCLGQPVFPMLQLGPDGHPTRGGFLPPVPLPRRMWAGGELEFLDALRVGDAPKRTSRIADVTLKSGSTGQLCFVSVQHEVSTARGTAIRERQDIVYREIGGTPSAATSKPAAPPPAAQHRETHISDPVLLFRYSALTFNGHRIHYDRDYVTKVMDRCRPPSSSSSQQNSAMARRRGNLFTAACNLCSRAASSPSMPMTTAGAWTCGPRMRTASRR
jgi:3-methylfumaryl-CoA hydratase